MLGSVGCRGTYESATRDDLSTAAAVIAVEEDTMKEPSLDGSLSSYLAFALARSPELRASFERWRAATMRISKARRMPEPIVRYSYFVRSIETRVGPQQHKLSVLQAFPWPTALSKGADAASSKARAAQRRFDAKALVVQQAVADQWGVRVKVNPALQPCGRVWTEQAQGQVYTRAAVADVILEVGVQPFVAPVQLGRQGQ